MEDDAENQENELLVLNSIFEDEDTFMSHEDNSGGSFYATVQLPEDCAVKLTGQMVQQARALGASIKEIGENSWSLAVMALPPIELNFQYPRDYPSQCPPRFTLSCKWLSVAQLNVLCEKLDGIWTSNVGEVVVFEWTELLKSETLECLGIGNPVVLDTSGLPRTLRQRSQLDAMATNPPGGPGGDDGGSVAAPAGGGAAVAGGGDSLLPAKNDQVRAVQDIAALTHLIPTIVTHDRKTREHTFSTSHNRCGVCFEDKFGRDCIQFSGCGHVFCKGCMREHFTVKISEGDVKGLTCPENECETQALAPQVKELVDPDLYQKYDDRLLDLSLSEMGDIVFCPRTACQSPVVREQNENMGICPSCRLAFCVLCKSTFHGVSPCKVTKEDYQRIKDNYESATDDERAILEQKYGKKTLRQVIENCNSEEWLRKHSKECPNCSRPIQKFDGCNKMTCTKCRCYFCWLCYTVLPRSDPYSHYRGSGQCANLLFQGTLVGDAEGSDDEDQDDGAVDIVNIENWWQFI